MKGCAHNRKSCFGSLKEAAVTCEAVDFDVFFVKKNIHAGTECAESREKLCADEICHCEVCVLSAHEKRAAFCEACDAFARKIVEGEQAAAVFVACES